jgi:hypothetical protein
MSKEYSLRLLATMLISVAICAVVNALFFCSKMTAGLLLESMGLGILIWLVSEFTFSVTSKRWPHNIIPSYIALLVIIAIGTSAGTRLFGVTSFRIILMICTCAEVCGFTITILCRQIYKKRLNTKLNKYKSGEL